MSWHVKKIINLKKAAVLCKMGWGGGGVILQSWKQWHSQWDWVQKAAILKRKHTASNGEPHSQIYRLQAVSVAVVVY